MTELEKAKNNRSNEIDFNRLANELHDAIQLYNEKMEHTFRTGGTRPSMEETLSPAIMILSSLNAFINRIGVDLRIAPHVIASIELLKNCRSMTLNDNAKDCAREIVKVLAPSITTIDTSLF